MNRDELERAWPAAEPPPGFSERVLERLSRSPAPSPPEPRRASTLVARMGARWRWLVLPVAALALAGALWLRSAGPAHEGQVMAAEPRVAAIGERAVAELSSGAALSWSGDEVQQARGAVTYRVQPGTAFRVMTPHGSVFVLGTVFRVVVANGQEASGEQMDKRWVAAGAGAVLGALLWVSVDEGSVVLSGGEEQLVLRAGQAGAIAADGSPRLAAAPAAPAPAAVAVQGGDDERMRARQVADAVRRHAARRREAARAAAVDARPAAKVSAPQPAPPPIEYFLPTTPGTKPTLPPMSEEAARRREYLSRAVREQYFPAARDCYGELLERQPSAGGKVVLEFAIVGDGDAGVVDRVALREEESTLDDPEFVLCMRESMYTAVFEPPPPGASETTVVYPIELRPD